MKKRILIIFISFLFFVKPKLSFAENWEPILQVFPILTKNTDLLNTRITEVLKQFSGQNDRHIKNLKTILSFRTALPIEVCIKSFNEMGEACIENLKIQRELMSLMRLWYHLILLQDEILIVKLLLTHNPNLKGSERIKDIIKLGINYSLNSINEALKDKDISYESSSVVRKIKSDLEEVLVILQ
jgi:hypothetical protein